jgi:DNA mismatch repair protein MSH4
MIKEFGFCKVEFIESPEIRISHGWNLAKAEEEQVKNDVYIDLTRRISILTGSNMSGKTFYLKMLTWVLLCAQATGFAPADYVSMPLFENIIYLDRVSQNMDLNLSAFGNEVEYWKKFFNVLEKGNALLIGALDEIASTTSPRYQSALSFAIAEAILKTGNYGILAHHNHDFIDAFSSTYPQYTALYHLNNRIEDGEIIFEYELREGHQVSNAIEVARTLGFDEEILRVAEEIRAGIDAERRENGK